MPDIPKTRKRVANANKALQDFKDGKILVDPKVLRKELREAIKEYES